MIGINTLDSTNVLGAMRGGHAKSYSDISPQTILSKFKTPYFFLNMLLRCCLCNSTFIWAKVRSGQR